MKAEDDSLPSRIGAEGNGREGDTVVQAEAAAWVRQRDAGLSPAQLDEFRRWLASDPRHRPALEQADAARTELDWPWHADTVGPILAGLENCARRRRRRRAALAVAGLALLIATGSSWLARPPAPTSGQGPPPTLVVREVQSRILPDGSRVELNQDTRIEIEYSAQERRVVLSRGAAHFQVASNPAVPFVVRAGPVAVRAVGTAFTVLHDSADVAVVVTEGSIAVDRAATTRRDRTSPESSTAAEPPTSATAPHAVLAAGEAILVPATGDFEGVLSVRPVAVGDLAEKLAWRVARLEFSHTPLAEIVEQMNGHALRLGSVRLRLGDPTLGRIRLSGVLRADNVPALVAMLAEDFSVQASRVDADTLELHWAP